MRLIFHGTLRQLFGESYEMSAATPAEALEGFSRQVDWPRDITVHLVGFNTVEKLKDNAEQVHVMPALRGGGGKFGSIILGAAVVAVGVALTVTGAGAVGIPLIISGSLMMVQGVIALFLKSPKLKSVDDPEASKYLPINRNTTAVGTPMTHAWGRIDLAGHWLSLQSDSTNLSFGSFPASPS
jgi:predicted phage tail protein